eukprot:scaffold108187_cov19-Tisochrysis_lutea.AAC.1
MPSKKLEMAVRAPHVLMCVCVHPQSVTALAHLRAACVYIVDISEECGYTIAQQAALFHSIKALFANKPILVICNKIDVRKLMWASEGGLGAWVE